MTYKKISEKLDKQQETLHKIDKCVAVIRNDVKRINGTLLNHQKKNEEQDEKINNLSKSVSGLKGKMAGVAAVVGGLAGWLFNILGKYRIG